ncbi:MAG: type III secretion system chaperone [Kiritimatiellae bacterium]|nr:type III secretion system chaperone [Kiritimatiellia bacterium]
MELKELASAFAAKLGIDGLTVEDGVCALEIDGIPLQLAEMPDGKALVATAVVGTPPPEKTEAFLELLLEANTETLGSQDRALGKLHDTGEVVLQWRIPTRDLELDGFCAELEAFVNQVEQWRLALENFRPAAEEAVARDEDIPGLGLPASGFISV